MNVTCICCINSIMQHLCFYIKGMGKYIHGAIIVLWNIEKANMWLVYGNNVAQVWDPISRFVDLLHWEQRHIFQRCRGHVLCFCLPIICMKKGNKWLNHHSIITGCYLTNPKKFYLLETVRHFTTISMTKDKRKEKDKKQKQKTRWSNMESPVFLLESFKGSAVIFQLRGVCWWVSL